MISKKELGILRNKITALDYRPTEEEALDTTETALSLYAEIDKLRGKVKEYDCSDIGMYPQAYKDEMLDLLAEITGVKK